MHHHFSVSFRQKINFENRTTVAMRLAPPPSPRHNKSSTPVYIYIYIQLNLLYDHQNHHIICTISKLYIYGSPGLPQMYNLRYSSSPSTAWGHSGCCALLMDAVKIYYHFISREN